MSGNEIMGQPFMEPTGKPVCVAHIATVIELPISKLAHALGDERVKLDIIASLFRASITASATFGHLASPDNVTYWHIMALQCAMKVCVKYYDNFLSSQPIVFQSFADVYFISMICKISNEIK